MRSGGRAGGWAVLLGGMVLWVVAAWADAPRVGGVPADVPRAGGSRADALAADVPRAGGSRADAPRVGGLPADTRLLALDAIDSCLLRLNSDIDIGYDRVVARCPTLVRRLDESGLSVWLPRDWRRPGNDLSAGGLRELREVVSRELTVGATARGRERPPGVESVPDILASLARSEDEHGGWWARTKVWLRNLFEEPEPAVAEGWLARIIGQSGLSQALVELVSYVALVIVVVLAVVIVANELRVGGVFGGWRRRFAVLADSPGGVRHDGGLAWGDVLSVPLPRRPGVLLELVVGRLVEGGRLRAARGLTAGELTRMARLPEEEDRDRLEELARTAERVRFSNVAVSDVDIAAAVEGGRVLLERIGPDGAGAGL
ncbi:MAG: hypothetical protein JWL65_872 [Gammaproteobacteria bacterium]|nr:hypothetical protein [Gammaproteobacteria bacterium]